MANDGGLNRHLAPIPGSAWDVIEEVAKDTLKVYLGGRKLVDFTGPVGWDAAAVATGYVEPIGAALTDGVQVRKRRVQPFVELRVPFTLEREELDSTARGNKAPDVDALVAAARKIAAAEDRLVFQGLQEAGVSGVQAHSEHGPLQIGDDYNAYPQTVAEAIARLQEHGVAGPYAVALGPQCFRGLTTTTTPGGYPVIEHVRRLLDGPIVSAPSISGAVVLSLRGGDFELVVGRDLSIGYLEHDARRVQLFLEESLTFRLHGPDAAVPLVYPR